MTFKSRVISQDAMPVTYGTHPQQKKCYNLNNNY